MQDFSPDNIVKMKESRDKLNELSTKVDISGLAEVLKFEYNY